MNAAMLPILPIKAVMFSKSNVPLVMQYPIIWNTNIIIRTETIRSPILLKIKSFFSIVNGLVGLSVVNT